VALQVGHRDAQQLTARRQVPHANVAHSSSSKNLTVLVGERQVIDLVAVRSLDELIGQPAQSQMREVPENLLL